MLRSLATSIVDGLTRPFAKMEFFATFMPFVIGCVLLAAGIVASQALLDPQTADAVSTAIGIVIFGVLVIYVLSMVVIAMTNEDH